ncbi:MAG TPA: enoyl-CoA hydratase [Acidimicrobiales bacterium]
MSVRTETGDGVAVVVLDDPGRRNALTQAMVDGIVTAFDRLEVDGGIGAVIVTGAPPAFCAGADLGDLAGGTRQGLLAIYEGFLRVARSPLATVAAVNGAAVGAGMNLALACDVRLAGRSARFDTRFLDLGLHPGGGHTWLLRRAVGDAVARAMLLFGRRLDGEAAARTGLAWAVVDDDTLLDEARDVARAAASAPRQLVAEIKRTLADMAAVDDHPSAVERELAPQVQSMEDPAFAERLAALRRRVARPD